MNSYSKFVPNVFLAKCPEKHERGDIISVTTQYGKENESIVFNLIYQKEGFFYYSIVRADGFNCQQRAKLKSEKYNGWAQSAEKKSDQHYNAAKEIGSYIPMGQPILIGHHSENRHRRDIGRIDSNMGKSIEFTEKAESHESKAEYWDKKTTDINLSMPESIEYYTYKLEKAKEYHAGLKSGKYERAHSFSLTYAKKEVNDIEKNLQLAVRLWGQATQ